MIESRPTGQTVLLPALVLLVAASTIAGIVVFTAASGLTESRFIAAAAGVVFGGGVGVWLRRHPVLRGSNPPARGLRWLSAVAAVALVLQIVRLTVFIVEPTATRWSVLPWNAWVTTHSCVAGYWTAAREARSVPDLYADAFNMELPSGPGASPAPRRVGIFPVDSYEYPPTFLLLPRALMLVVPDFFDFRRVWFALNLAVVVIALVAIGRRLAAAGTAALWLTPIVLAPFAITSTLQIGNFQLACIALTMLAMLAIERSTPRSRWRLPLGTLALAFATVSKLYPGMLVLYLLARRNWSAVAWSAGWGVLLVAAGLLDLGLTPHYAFAEHLPRLLSGEAFAALRNPNGASGNMSVPGIVFKLGVVYGVPHMSYDAARIVGWLHTAAAVGVAARLAFRPLPRTWEPLAWLAILIIATLRSPTLPPYGAFAPLWLAVAMLPIVWSRARDRILWLVMVAIFLPVTPAQSLLPPAAHAVVTLVQTITALVLVVLTLRLHGRDAPSAPRPAVARD